jgi:hypothetical protein
VRRRRLRDEPDRIDVLNVAILYPANGRIGILLLQLF